MSWHVKIAKKVPKQMKRFPVKDKKRILAVLEQMSVNPYQGDIEKIEGEKNLWRRRIGDYRIAYELFSPQGLVSVLDAQRRTTTAYRKRKK